MTDRFTHDAAPYVLGALSPEDRHAFEAHLAGCEACTAEVRRQAQVIGLQVIEDRRCRGDPRVE